jgi:hypothetical protein
MRPGCPRKNQHFYGFLIDEDGTFLVEDVAPGTYQLMISFTEPVGDDMYGGRQIGSVNRDLVVAEAADGPASQPVTLGEFKVELMKQ